MDARTKLPLDPEEALRALLKADPESEPVEQERPPAPRSKQHERSDDRRT